MSKPIATPKSMPETGITIAVVTDHAVLRYIERRHGVDIEAIRALIRESCRNGVRLGARAVKADGMRFIIKDDSVVTCHLIVTGERKG